MSNLNPELAVESQELDLQPSPSRETKDRFPEDEFLRRFGYVIHSRKSGEQAFWKQPGERGILPHSVAVAVAVRRVANVGKHPRR